MGPPASEREARRPDTPGLEVSGQAAPRAVPGRGIRLRAAHGEEVPGRAVPSRGIRTRAAHGQEVPSRAANRQDDPGTGREAARAHTIRARIIRVRPARAMGRAAARIPMLTGPAETGRRAPVCTDRDLFSPGEEARERFFC